MTPCEREVLEERLEEKTGKGVGLIPGKVKLVGSRDTYHSGASTGGNDSVMTT